MKRSYFFIVSILGSALFGFLAADTTISGVVTHVRDVDTIEVDGLAIRLNGLDGPELSEPFGLEARSWLINILENQKVSCSLNGDKTYDRLVGTCFQPNGKDIAEAIVEAGYGRDCPRYSGGKYAEFENETSRAHKAHKYCKKR